MKTSQSRGFAAIDRALTLFLDIVEDAGETPLSTLAKRAALPVSTAQRLVGVFLERGLLCRIRRGRYAVGVRLSGVAAAVTPREALIAASRPLLERLARALGTTLHLGVLEGDMVTYLVKAHGGGPDLLTSEMSQLEAYCSGIGKVLLANLDVAAQNAYLAAGPFVALTENTITDPLALRTAFERVRRDGYAIDDAEIQDDLHCVAVPVWASNDRVIAALSASSKARFSGDVSRLDKLKACATQISARLRRDAGQIL